ACVSTRPTCVTAAMSVRAGTSMAATRGDFRRVIPSGCKAPRSRPTYGNLKMPFSLFLALRYLKPKRTFLSIITLISVIGVTLGVTVLILVISVMTGFDRELRQKVIDFDAHILVTTDGVMTDWRELMPKLNKTPGVVA